VARASGEEDINVHTAGASDMCETDDTSRDIAVGVCTVVM
jgi:hypothetical protein